MLYASIQCNSMLAHSIHCNTLQQCVPLPRQRSNTRWRRGGTIRCTTCSDCQRKWSAALVQQLSAHIAAPTVSVNPALQHAIHSITAVAHSIRLCIACCSAGFALTVGAAICADKLPRWHNILPQYYRNITAILPHYYRNITAILPQ